MYLSIVQTTIISPSRSSEPANICIPFVSIAAESLKCLHSENKNVHAISSAIKSLFSSTLGSGRKKCIITLLKTDCTFYLLTCSRPIFLHLRLHRHFHLQHISFLVSEKDCIEMDMFACSSWFSLLYTNSQEPRQTNSLLNFIKYKIHNDSKTFNHYFLACKRYLHCAKAGSNTEMFKVALFTDQLILFFTYITSAWTVS